MVIKLDLEKACDRLKWSFIEETLMDASIPDRVRKVIMSLLKSEQSGSYPLGGYDRVIHSRPICFSCVWKDSVNGYTERLTGVG